MPLSNSTWAAPWQTPHEFFSTGSETRDRAITREGPIRSEQYTGRPHPVPPGMRYVSGRPRRHRKEERTTRPRRGCRAQGKRQPGGAEEPDGEGPYRTDKRRSDTIPVSGLWGPGPDLPDPEARPEDRP